MKTNKGGFIMSGMKGMKWGVTKYRPFDGRSIESKLKESKENKEGLALDILANALGNEESTNKACDLIKALGLVDDYH